MQSRTGLSSSGNSYGTMNFGGGESGGPFSFIIGALSLLTSFGLTVYDHNKHEVEREAYYNAGYNQIVQNGRYDGDRQYLRDKYDILKVVDSVKQEYPRMSEVMTFEVAYIAIAKKLMETETKFKYQVPEKFQFLGDLARFATEDCAQK